MSIWDRLKDETALSTKIAELQTWASKDSAWNRAACLQALDYFIEHNPVDESHPEYCLYTQARSLRAEIASKNSDYDVTGFIFDLDNIYQSAWSRENYDQPFFQGPTILSGTIWGSNIIGKN